MDDTKNCYTVASLSLSIAARAVHLLENSPDTDKYGTPKTHLLETFGLTESERAHQHQLLAFPSLDDAKPFEVMDHMLILLGNHQPGFTFRALFLQQMPEQIHATDRKSTRMNSSHIPQARMPFSP